MIPLFSELLSSSLPSVQAACFVLTHASLQGLIGVDPVINNFISSCATARYWAVCVDALGEIMTKKIVAVVEETGSYQCPYSLRWVLYLYSN